MTKTDRYVFDTNTLISAFLSKGSVASQALEKGIKKGTIYFTNETFSEFQDVIFRKKFDKYVTLEERIQIIESLANKAEFVVPISNDAYCRDPDDDKFLNLAIDILANSIVSGDNDLLILNPFKNIQIINAADFMKAL